MSDIEWDDEWVDPLNTDDPYRAQFVIINPSPAFAAVMGLPEAPWYCSAQVIDGEHCTAITMREEVMYSLRTAALDGTRPDDLWAEYMMSQFHWRRGWPVDWLEIDC